MDTVWNSVTYKEQAQLLQEIGSVNTKQQMLNTQVMDKWGAQCTSQMRWVVKITWATRKVQSQSVLSLIWGSQPRQTFSPLMLWETILMVFSRIKSLAVESYKPLHKVTFSQELSQKRHLRSTQWKSKQSEMEVPVCCQIKIWFIYKVL